MEKKTIEIRSINLKIGRKEISLTVVEAKKLKEVLSEMFEKEIVHHYDNNWWYTPSPVIGGYPFIAGPASTGTTTNFLTIDVTS